MIATPTILLSLFLSLASVSRAEAAPDASADPFPVPEGLEPAIEFWKRIFTEFSTRQMVFFDPLAPDRVYRVVEIEEGRRARYLVRRERKRIMAAHRVPEERVRAQRGIKERFAAGLSRSRRYLEPIQRIFRERGLPVELAYLPLIESSFDIHARSHAGAVGMWQFIRSTGRRFLRIDRHVDERKDPWESSRAAAALLKENYELLGSWPLAITAYNHGQEGIARAVARTGSRDLMVLIRRYESRRWGFASKNFYAEFLAAVRVAQSAHLHFPDLEYLPPAPVEEREIEEPVSLASIIGSLGISRAELLAWNPALHPRISTLPRGYRLKLPARTVVPAAASAGAALEPTAATAPSAGEPPEASPSAPGSLSPE